MPFLALPWVIGPVPILATIWSAYVTTTALVYRGEMTGERFVAAFLLPLGIISLISLIFLKTFDLPVLVTVGQIATTICFVAIYAFEKKRSSYPLLIPADDVTINNMSWMLYFLVVVYIIYFIFLFAFPVSEACTIGKCHALELLLGGKGYGFSVLYSLNFVGSVILTFIVATIFSIIAKIKVQH
ncbi:hypothetical protein ACCC98_25115 [Rhizobium pisi]|uniref:hypothetical protein n=1 Tax=Rhizobium pisi TaxID=574561 RepID=UPI0039B052B5